MLQKIPIIALVFTLVIAVVRCNVSAKENTVHRNSEKAKAVPIDSPLQKKVTIDSSKIAFGFDFPVGKPDAKGYYDYQGFTKNNHLGEDWNGLSGGNTDLGDTIYAIGNGQVTYAENFGGGWGNTIRIVHKLPDGENYESVYAHCDTILTMAHSWVFKGEPIGTIGTANGQYYAHLHLEIREKVGLPIGNGYSSDTTGYVNPTEFIKKYRQISNELNSDSTENR